MMSFRPTPGQERWLRVASRVKLARDTPWLASRLDGWTAATALARSAFFLLGLFASGLLAAIFELLHVPDFLVLTGLILVAAAEYLIVGRRLFGTGIEEALEVAGLLMIAFNSIDRAGFSVESPLPWLVAAVLLAAGFRLLNSLFITLGVAALSYAIGYTGLFGAAGHALRPYLAGAFCLSVAGAALFLSGLPVRRISYDQMLNWLIITMPLAAYLWYETSNPSGLTIESLHHSPNGRLALPMMVVGFGLIALVIGIRRRVHAPIIAAMICVGCAAFELRNLTPLSLELKLIIWGAVTLFLMLGLDRYLRTPRRGITSSRFTDEKGVLDLLQFVGASDLAPQGAAPPAAPFKGGGGHGAGGGASGSY